MSKAWSHALSEFTKLPNKAYRWPTSSPTLSQGPRFSRRSQLRFSPAKTLQERWVARCLSITHSYLRSGYESAALAYCYSQITVPRGDCLEFLHSAVSLFTRHGSFGAALKLCNRMIDIGFLLQNKTFMLLLRGDHSQQAEFLEKISDAMARGGVRMDDLTFKSILDTMVRHRCPPQDIEKVLESFKKTKEKDWVPTVGIFHTIIRAWSFAGGLDRAEFWLTGYRDAFGPGHQQSDISHQSSLSKPTLPEENPLKEERSPRPRSAPITPRHLYMAVLTGLARSHKPAAERVQRLLTIMRQDGIELDIEMYNAIIRALLRWGMLARAFRMFEGVLRPGPRSTVVPDAYTFRHIFIALNPIRRRSARIAPGQHLPDQISTRHVFSEMIKVSRLRLRSRKPLPHKNIISTATFNCALGTFCAEDDYAAVWTVLALFTWFHIVPDTKTSWIVMQSLLRRMRYEMSSAYDITDVLWLDKFSSERRSDMVTKSDKIMLADRLHMIGRVSLAEMRHMNFQRYLRPSNAFDDETAIELEFLIALMRSALQAELGFQTLTLHAVEAEKAISKVMLQARHDIIPRGRMDRR